MTTTRERRMTDADRVALRAQIATHEGLRLKMYTDSVGVPTIGFGHNLQAKGISRRAADVILDDDIGDVTRALRVALPWVTELDGVRQGVVIEMGFQLGIAGLLGFKRTLALIKGGQYAAAATAMLKSLAASQTPARWKTLARQLRTGIR